MIQKLIEQTQDLISYLKYDLAQPLSPVFAAKVKAILTQKLQQAEETLGELQYAQKNGEELSWITSPPEYGDLEGLQKYNNKTGKWDKVDDTSYPENEVIRLKRDLEDWDLGGEG